jgi:hypothetical protein
MNSGLLEHAVNAMTLAINIAAGVIRVITTVIDALKNPLDTVKSAASKFGTAIKDAAAKGIDAVTGLPKKIKDAIGDLGTLLKDKGKDLVRGLWDGIKSMGSWLFDKVLGFIKDNLPAPVRKALESRSPSKVGAKLGRTFPQGIAAGIAKDAPLVASQASAMAQRTIAAFGDLTAPAPTFAAASGTAGVDAGTLAPGIPGAPTADGWILHADIYIGNELLAEQTVRIVRRENRAQARKFDARPREI